MSLSRGKAVPGYGIGGCHNSTLLKQRSTVCHPIVGRLGTVNVKLLLQQPATDMRCYLADDLVTDAI